MNAREDCLHLYLQFISTEIIHNQITVLFQSVLKRLRSPDFIKNCYFCLLLDGNYNYLTSLYSLRKSLQRLIAITYGLRAWVASGSISFHPSHESKPLAILGGLLADEGEGSILHTLRGMNFATEIYVFNNLTSTPVHSSFCTLLCLCIKLSKLGSKHWDQVSCV
ncbi:hypothetical protein AHF37_12276 [Paragonimus kellicotti]|nr:hypothetical protein AHF37_12276 [Paragonimus kellicotti]